MQSILFNSIIRITEPQFSKMLETAITRHHSFNTITVINNISNFNFENTHVAFYQLNSSPVSLELLQLTELAKHLKLVIVADSEQLANLAYEIGAIDFILTSANSMRINHCFEKLIHLCPLVNAHHQKHLQEQENSHLIVRDVGKVRLVDIEEIVWINGAGNYVELHCQDSPRPILHRETMKNLTEKLASKGFIRIHRSTLVRKKAISELIPTDCGDYKVILKSNTILNLSRRFKMNLEGILGI